MKRLLLILNCTSKPGRSICYKFNKDTEVYIIYNFDLLQEYVKDLLKSKQSDHEITILLIYQQIHALLDATKLLYLLTSDEKRKKYLDRFKQLYKLQLAMLTGNTSQKPNTNFEIRLPQGIADMTFGFETLFAYDVSGFRSLDHLKVEKTGVQQLLRYLALKHGACYGAFSGPLTELENIESCQILISSLKGELIKGNDQHIFSNEGDSITEELSLHQSIPLGWDLWSKIQLVAKLIARSSDWHLLDEEVKVEDLNDLYEEYVKGEDNQFQKKAELIVGYKEKPKMPEPEPRLTYQDMVARVEEALQS